jgi:predicted transcriptional regulator
LRSLSIRDIDTRGVLTEFDLLNAAREGKDLQTLKAEDLMSRTVVWPQKDDAPDAITVKMAGQSMIRLSVLGEDGQLIQVIARADILSHLIEPEFVAIGGM